MEKFILISSKVISDNLEVNVCLKPSNILINDFIATYKVFENETIADLEIPNYISEMTPLLFGQFEQMANVPIEIRNQFEL